MLFMVKDSNRLISKFWVHELIPHIHVHAYVYFCTYYYIKLKRELFKKIKFLFVWKNPIVRKEIKLLSLINKLEYLLSNWKLIMNKYN